MVDHLKTFVEDARHPRRGGGVWGSYQPRAWGQPNEQPSGTGVDTLSLLDREVARQPGTLIRFERP